MEKNELEARFNKSRKDFPILREKVNGKNLIYVDNAATTQKPQQVINKIVEYYSTMNSNVHRGIHTLSEKATSEFEKVRDNTANFINSSRDEIIFTSGTTQSINIVTQGIEEYIEKNDEILLSDLEHHANLVPWQELAKKKQAKLKFFSFDKNYQISLGEVKKKVNSRTKIIAFPHISNVTGTIFPAKEICSFAKEKEIITLVDAAQSVSHMEVDVKDINCDFLVFSAHKMCGPTGVGILYGKKKQLEKLKPSTFGGSMIEDVSYQESSYSKAPYCFEAGTPNIAGVIGLGSAIEYIKSLGLKEIEKYKEYLSNYFLEKISTIEKVKIIGPVSGKRASVFTFTIEGLHAFDISELLDKDGIALRSGHHCTIPLHKKINISGTARVSFYFYNTIEEIDIIINSVKKIISKFVR